MNHHRPALPCTSKFQQVHQTIYIILHQSAMKWSNFIRLHQIWHVVKQQTHYISVCVCVCVCFLFHWNFFSWAAQALLRQSVSSVHWSQTQSWHTVSSLLYKVRKQLGNHKVHVGIFNSNLQQIFQVLDSIDEKDSSTLGGTLAVLSLQKIWNSVACLHGQSLWLCTVLTTLTM